MDEYVALLDGKGEIVAKAEISYSDLQNVKGVFESVEVEAGDAEGPLQTDSRRVKYLEVIDPPTVDSIASEGKDGIVKGEAFAAIGANLSWKDGDKVTVKWTEDGEEKSLEITPKATTPTKMDFAAVDAFDEIPDDTELTFEFELSGETVDGETRIVGA